MRLRHYPIIGIEKIYFLSFLSDLSLIIALPCERPTDSCYKVLIKAQLLLKKIKFLLSSSVAHFVCNTEESVGESSVTANNML